MSQDPATPSGPPEPVAPSGRPADLPGTPLDPARAGTEEVVAELEERIDQEDDSRLFPYQAVVVTSFGGPEGPDEVMPFLRRVTAGRGIPDERLEEVAQHYLHFGGRSPINEQNRALVAALGEELARRELRLPVLLGNRNSEPFLADTLRSAHQEGMTRVLAVTTSAYSSYSSCRQYREDIAAALASLTEEGRTVAVDKVRPYWNHPGFSRANARIVAEGVRQMTTHDGDGTETRDAPYLVLVTHSIPLAMDDTSGPGDGEGNLYSRQHLELASAIAKEASATLSVELQHDLVYCSRSGAPSQPWLEPDVNDHLRALAARGVTRVVLAPIGFVSDHMEVVFDLDTEAVETAQELGMELLRVPTVGTDAEFVSGLVDLVLERAAEARGEAVDRPTWPGADPRPSICAPGCCPNLRAARPAACGRD